MHHDQDEASRRQADFVLQELSPAEKEKAILASLQHVEDDSESVETIFDESLQHSHISVPEQPLAADRSAINALVNFTPLQNKGINSVEESGNKQALSSCDDTIDGHNADTPVGNSVFDKQDLPSHVSNTFSVGSSSSKLSVSCLNVVRKFWEGSMHPESPADAAEDGDEFSEALSKSQRKKQKKNKKIILQRSDPYNTRYRDGTNKSKQFYD